MNVNLDYYKETIDKYFRENYYIPYDEKKKQKQIIFIFQIVQIIINYLIKNKKYLIIFILKIIVILKIVMRKK